MSLHFEKSNVTASSFETAMHRQSRTRYVKPITPSLPLSFFLSLPSTFVTFYRVNNYTYARSYPSREKEDALPDRIRRANVSQIKYLLAPRGRRGILTACTARMNLISKYRPCVRRSSVIPRPGGRTAENTLRRRGDEAVGILRWSRHRSEHSRHFGFEGASWLPSKLEDDPVPVPVPVPIRVRFGEISRESK